MKAFYRIRFFAVVFLFGVLFSGCQHDDDPETVPVDVYNTLRVEQISLSQLQEHPDLAGLLSNTTSKMDLYKGSSGNPEKDATEYTILTARISKAAFKTYEAYTFLIENPEQPPFSFDNYVVQKHHNGTVEEFILRYSYDMTLWLGQGQKKFSSITRYDTEYNQADTDASKDAAQKTDCEVYVTVYHETPEDGTYEWEPGAVCHHTTEGDMCTVIIEYTLDCSGGGGGETQEPAPEGGSLGGADPGVGDPGAGMLPDNGGPGSPISTMEPPLGPEAGAGDLFYLRQLIEQEVSPATTEAELINKNNALAVYLNQLNPFIFNELSLLLVSVNAESELTLEDRTFLWEKARSVYDILKTKEETAPDHITSEEFLNSLSPQEQEEFTENIVTTALLPAVKSVAGIQWPQTTEEWMAVFNLIKPMLIEIGIEFLPLGGLYNAINDMTSGLSEGDYTLAAIGLAGVLMEFIPWGKLLKVGKALFSAGKKAFRIFKLTYNFLGQIGDAVALGLKTVLDGSTVKLVNQAGDEVASIADNIMHVSKHGIKAADGSVVFRNADEVNGIIAAQNYTDPAFIDEVTEFVTGEAEQFVRFHDVENVARPWVMKASDVQNLTEPQLRNLFSIPPGNPIPKVSYVDVPPGTKIYSGTANGLYSFDGGGLQFYIDKVQFGGPDSYVPEEWFVIPALDIDNFLN